MFEKTLVLIKPDAVELGLTIEIIRRFTTTGFTVVTTRCLVPTVELVEAHYRKKFQESPEIRSEVVAYLTSGPLVAMLLAREDAVLVARGLIGPLENAPAGTIRGDFKSDHIRSLVHASDSSEAVEYEARVWFPADTCASVSKFVRSRRKTERELLFAHAIACQQKGDISAAKQYAIKCLERLKIEADNAPIEDVASTTIGSGFPGLLHTQTALREFRAAGIEI